MSRIDMLLQSVTHAESHSRGLRAARMLFQEEGTISPIASFNSIARDIIAIEFVSTLLTLRQRVAALPIKGKSVAALPKRGSISVCMFI